MRRAIRAGALLALLLPGAGLARQAGLAARVDGVGIERERLERSFEEYAAQKGRIPAAIQSPDTYKQLMREALDQLIDGELLAQEAARRGLVPSAEAVQARLAEARSHFPSELRFRLRLERSGFTEESFEAHVRKQLAIEQLVQRELLPGVTVTADDVHRAYLAEPGGFRRPGGDELVPEAEAAPALREQLRAARLQEAVRERIAALRLAARIEILVPL